MKQNSIALVSFCITNVALTLILKLQGGVKVNEAGKQQNFYHPFMQTWMLLFGQSLCIIPYLLSKDKINNTLKKKSSIAICLVPLILDLNITLLTFAALNYVSGSVFSMMTSQVIVFTAIFSKILLKKTFSIAHIIGCILTIIGALLAGYAQHLSSKSEKQQQWFIIGCVILTITFILQGVQTPIMQKIYQQYDICPLQMVGYQGIIGTIFWTILITVLNNLGCPFGEDQCVFDINNNGHVQNSNAFLQQINNNTYLFILILGFILAGARFNYDLNTVIVKTCSLTLCILRIFSNSFVWIIGIIISLIGKQDEQFQLESLDLSANFIKLLAFMICTLGLLIYNGVFNKEKVENQITSQQHSPRDLLQDRINSKQKRLTLSQQQIKIQQNQIQIQKGL